MQSEVVSRWSSNTIARAEVLTADMVLELFLGKVAAIIVPRFCSEEVINHALKKPNANIIQEYSNADGVGKVKDCGMAYFETENKLSLRKEYYAQVLSSTAEVRNLFQPDPSPVDKIQSILKTQWSKGTSLLDLGEGPMFVGLIRATKKEILPHEDKLERDDPSIVAKVNYMTQASFNCYLSVPKKGGELQLWDFSLADKRYDAMRGSSYGIARSLLPPPDISIQPQQGDLILFNPRFVHAVSPIEEDTLRLTASGFILFEGQNKPLSFWS